MGKLGDVQGHQKVAALLLSLDPETRASVLGKMSEEAVKRVAGVTRVDRMPALQLFGAGREKRIYAIPPYTPVESLDFEDYPFEVQRWDEACTLCGATDSYLDEVITDDRGGRMFVCSDTQYCGERRCRGQLGSEDPGDGYPAPAGGT